MLRVSPLRPYSLWVRVSPIHLSLIHIFEWPGLIEEILPEKVTWVTIEKDLEKGFDYRRISVEDRG